MASPCRKGRVMRSVFLRSHPDGRRVTVSFHRGSETFTPKTLKRIIEDQARWTEDDLKRLGLL